MVTFHIRQTNFETKGLHVQIQIYLCDDILVCWYVCSCIGLYNSLDLCSFVVYIGIVRALPHMTIKMRFTVILMWRPKSSSHFLSNTQAGKHSVGAYCLPHFFRFFNHFLFLRSDSAKRRSSGDVFLATTISGSLDRQTNAYVFFWTRSNYF